MDRCGQYVVPAVYDYCTPFSKELAMARKKTDS
ncbi:MAG: WG repeat-containing protein [Candidatus Cryptobacteroides sp.]